MKKLVMLSVMVLILGMVGTVNGGTLYVSLSDTMPSVGWYDLAGNYVYMGTFPGPVQDLEFDKATGDLFGLTTIGVVRMNQDRVFSQITTTGAPQNQGGDIALSSTGDVAVSLTDATNIVDLYDSDGTPIVTVTFSSASAVADIEYDKATDDLYAYTDTGVFKRDTGGVITQIPGLAGAAVNAGGDIAISSNGLIAVSMNDSMVSVGIYTLGTPAIYYDMANFNSPVQDIDYDMNTGDLYAYTDAGIKKFVDTPGPYNGGVVTSITGVAYPNAGGDIAWAPDWECAEAADCYDDDACTVDDCACDNNLCDCGESTPLVCPSDDNDCTDDTCDAVSGCVYTCNACNYADECCADPACSGEPVCDTPGCFGSTALEETVDCGS